MAELKQFPRLSIKENALLSLKSPDENIFYLELNLSELRNCVVSKGGSYFENETKRDLSRRLKKLLDEEMEKTLSQKNQKKKTVIPPEILKKREEMNVAVILELKSLTTDLICRELTVKKILDALDKYGITHNSKSSKEILAQNLKNGIMHYQHPARKTPRRSQGKDASRVRFDVQEEKSEDGDSDGNEKDVEAKDRRVNANENQELEELRLKMEEQHCKSLETLRNEMEQKHRESLAALRRQLVEQHLQNLATQCDHMERQHRQSLETQRQVLKEQFVQQQREMCLKLKGLHSEMVALRPELEAMLQVKTNEIQTLKTQLETEQRQRELLEAELWEYKML